jgi:hypothetical protein
MAANHRSCSEHVVFGKYSGIHLAAIPPSAERLPHLETQLSENTSLVRSRLVFADVLEHISHTDRLPIGEFQPQVESRHLVARLVCCRGHRYQHCHTARKQVPENA